LFLSFFSSSSAEIVETFGTTMKYLGRVLAAMERRRSGEEVRVHRGERGKSVERQRDGRRVGGNRERERERERETGGFSLSTFSTARRSVCVIVRA